MESSGFVQVVERKVSPPNPLVRAKLDWPFEPRKKRKLQPKEVAEIKTLLAHVRVGNMELEDISSAFSVSVDTVKKIRDEKTHVNVRAARWLKPAKKQRKSK